MLGIYNNDDIRHLPTKWSKCTSKWQNQWCINQYFCNKKGKLPHLVSHLCETVLCSCSNLTLSNLNFTHSLLHYHQTNVNSSVHYITYQDSTHYIALPFLLMEHIIYQDITHCICIASYLHLLFTHVEINKPLSTP